MTFKHARYIKTMKTAIITGGSDGIGRELCLEYGRQGYAISFTGRSKDKLNQTSELLKKEGINHQSYQLDAAKDQDNEQLVKETLDIYGNIDVIICNAGISMRVLFKDLSMESFDKVVKVNFLGAVSLIHHALPHLVKSQGSIIGISSINGRRATPARTAYAASKYALEGFLESLRMELKGDNVNVLAVCPGFTQTNMRGSSIMPDGNEQGETKLDESKMMSAQTVAKKVFRAMRRNRRDLILTTQGKFAVWGNKFFPRLMDKIVFKVMSKKPDSPFYKE